MRSHSNYDPDSGEVSLRTLKRMLPYILRYPALLGLSLACLVLAKLATIGMPFLLKDVVDNLDRSLTESVLALPLALLLAYGVARFSTVLFAELRDTIFGRVTEAAMRHIGLAVFRHLHTLDMAFHLDRNTGGLFRDIERGVSGTGFLLRFLVFNIVPTLLEIAMVLTVFLFKYSPVFAAVTAASIVAYVLWSVIATEWRTRFVREVNVADSKSHTRAMDSLLNVETVRVFGNEEREAGYYDEDLARWESARRKNRLTLFALNGGQALIVAVGMTSMLVLAGQGVVDESLTLGDFVLINAFMMQLFLPLNFLGFVYREIKGSLANIERMFGLLDQKPSITEAADAQDVPPGPFHVEFRDLAFAYQADRPILRKVSFSIAEGERVAIVGASGSGKSTLARLLYRFYDPAQGCILLKGVDIRTLRLASLRQCFALVPQDAVLFNASILENVRYGDPDASDEQVMAALEAASLGAFIATLPEGVETLVGERGLKLSGGEKQRVAIARALLRDPPLLVFDEATSSLDSVAEQSIVQSVRRLAQTRTTLVIAHRLTTVIDADRILVMQEGEIVESGTHSALLSLNGTYAHLWHSQH